MMLYIIELISFFMIVMPSKGFSKSRVFMIADSSDAAEVVFEKKFGKLEAKKGVLFLREPLMNLESFFLERDMIEKNAKEELKKAEQLSLRKSNLYLKPLTIVGRVTKPRLPFVIKKGSQQKSFRDERKEPLPIDWD